MPYKIPKTTFKRLLNQHLEQIKPIQPQALKLLHKHFEAYLMHIIKLGLQNAQDNRNTGNVTGKDIRVAFSYFIRE